MTDGLLLTDRSAPPSRRAARLPDEVRDGDRRYVVARAWPRGDAHALLELELLDPDPPERRAEAGGSSSPRIVAGQWFADPDALATAAAKAMSPARRARPGVSRTDRDGAVLLQPDGADARLPALAGVLARPDARLVVHRPGRRAVVRVPTDDGVEFVKVVRAAKGSQLAERGRLVEDLLGDLVVVPKLICEDGVDAGVLRWSDVGGTTLCDLGADAGRPVAQVRSGWELAGRALALLHGADRSRVAAEHGVDDELTAIGSWLRPAVHHGLLEADLVDAATERVARGLRAVPSAPVVGVLHRDLHDKQLLLRPDGRLGLIDVDTLTVGERALDVANVLVHLELRVGQRLLTRVRAEAAMTGLLAGLGQTAEHLWPRVPAYAAATRLRLAGVYAFRPRWRGLAVEMLAGLAT